MNTICAKNTRPLACADRQKAPPGRCIAAPSWVISASLAENCRFLSGRVDEVALLFFDSASSLAYGESDLALPLAELALSCHLHLPLDLPWNEPARCAKICVALLGKSRHLADGAGQKQAAHCRAVLHPPPHVPDKPELASQRLAAFSDSFIASGGNPALLFLENTLENDLQAICETALQLGFGFCLDAGHMLAHSQAQLLQNRDLLQSCGIVHLSAPGGPGKDSHAPLTELDAKERGACEKLVRSVPAEAVLVLEIFSWEGVAASLPIVTSWLLPCGNP